MITLACLGHTFSYELEHIYRLFFPGEQVRCVQEETRLAEDFVEARLTRDPGWISLAVRVRLEDMNCDTSASAELDAAAPGPEGERQLAVLLYGILCGVTGITPPWGILTGVRPVRLCRQWESQGLTREQISERFTREYLVKPHKLALTLETTDTQRHILNGARPDGYSLYISIPFCPTRCLYCSFVSHAVDKAAKLIPDYIACLCRELEATAGLARNLGLSLETVYIGGGTPTSLSAAQLEQILGAVATHFDLSALREYTVEAGRPDTVTPEKLAVLRKFGVGRVSINPQTMDDTILKAIGRGHTAAQVERSMALVRGHDFSAVNMDLIAGLPGEGEDSFDKTLNGVLSMKPENITLHTLTVKRSSGLRLREDAFSGSPLDLDGLLQTAQRRLGVEGYRPYYLYRQKGTLQNLENTGFSLPGGEGIYNVYSMEEMHTILAVGAGGVTKLCFQGNIRRVYNYKYPYEYIKRFQELLARKSSVEEFYEKHSGKKIHTG